jgi:hypothetical protein
LLTPPTSRDTFALQYLREQHGYTIFILYILYAGITALFNSPQRRKGRKEDNNFIEYFLCDLCAFAVSKRLVFFTCPGDELLRVVNFRLTKPYMKEQPGHSSLKMTVDVYGHLLPGSNRGAVNQLDSPQPIRNLPKQKGRNP